MAKLFLSLGVAFLAFTTLAASESLDFDSKIEIIENIADFKAAHPELDVVPLETSRNARQQIVYTIGNRISGDRLVATGADGASWATLQDVSLSLAYPQSGTGAVVTFVQVVVNQSSNQGRGYVVSGGIGQRSIRIAIEAYRTNYFNYNAQIYGY